MYVYLYGTKVCICVYFYIGMNMCNLDQTVVHVLMCICAYFFIRMSSDYMGVEMILEVFSRMHWFIRKHIHTNNIHLPPVLMTWPSRWSSKPLPWIWSIVVSYVLYACMYYICVECLCMNLSNRKKFVFSLDHSTELCVVLCVSKYAYVYVHAFIEVYVVCCKHANLMRVCCKHAIV
jgi:hypothetical protein